MIENGKSEVQKKMSLNKFERVEVILTILGVSWEIFGVSN